MNALVRFRRGVWLPALLVTATALGGCSMVASLTPVAGDGLSSVRTATTDVLLAEKHEILAGPNCESPSKTEITCSGKLVGGAQFHVAAEGSSDLTMKVTVGDKQVYSGSVQEVLDKAGRVNP